MKTRKETTATEKTCENRTYLNFELEKSVEIISFNTLISIMGKNGSQRR